MIQMLVAATPAKRTRWSTRCGVQTIGRRRFIDQDLWNANDSVFQVEQFMNYNQIDWNQVLHFKSND